MFQITINPETFRKYLTDLLEGNCFTIRESEAVQNFLASDPDTQNRDISQILFDNTTNELRTQLSKLVDDTIVDIIKANENQPVNVLHNTRLSHVQPSTVARVFYLQVLC